MMSPKRNELHLQLQLCKITGAGGARPAARQPWPSSHRRLQLASQHTAVEFHPEVTIPSASHRELRCFTRAWELLGDPSAPGPVVQEVTLLSLHRGAASQLEVFQQNLTVSASSLAGLNLSLQDVIYFIFIIYFNARDLCAKHSVQSVCGFEKWEKTVNRFKFFTGYQKPAWDVNSCLDLNTDILKIHGDLSLCCFVFFF